MRAAIFSLLPVRSGSTIASVRIGRWLSDLLGIPLLDDDKIAECGQLDVLFIINGSTLYCKYLEEVAQAIREARKVIWVQNDYTLPPPKAESAAQSPFRKAFADKKLVPDYWTTCGENAKATPGSAQVNWNALGALSNGKLAPLHSSSWLYYGAWREGRARSFKKMAQEIDDAGQELIVSSTSSKFSELPNVHRVPPFRENFAVALQEYGFGIYAQDAKSAGADHCPATRFYEMLSVGLPMVFTPDCAPTLKRYGYDVTPYILAYGAAKSMMLNRKEHRNIQQSYWLRDWEQPLIEQVKKLWLKIQ